MWRLFASPGARSSRSSTARQGILLFCEGFSRAARASQCQNKPKTLGCHANPLHRRQPTPTRHPLSHPLQFVLWHLAIDSLQPARRTRDRPLAQHQLWGSLPASAQSAPPPLLRTLRAARRCPVGWMLAHRESEHLAEQLVRETVAKQGVVGDQRTIHSDRGPSMRSQTVAQLLATPGIT